jgi:hypothetical protein
MISNLPVYLTLIVITGFACCCVESSKIIENPTKEIASVRLDTVDVVIPNTKFTNFVFSIPVFEIGFTMSSDQAHKVLSIESEYIPEGASLIGRLPSNEKQHLILYTYPADIQLPILEVYDYYGVKIGKFNFFDYNFAASIINENQYCRYQVLGDYTIKRVNYERLEGFEKIVYVDTLKL